MRLPNSESKWWIPMHLTLMTLTLLAVALLTPKADAADENGDAFCLAKNIYFEAGNQPYAGKVAVSQVVMNRVMSNEYPDDICGVVYQAKLKENWKGNLMPVRHMCQFSWYCDGKSDVPEDSATWNSSLQIAYSLLYYRNDDITEGATHYHNDTVHPYWADSLNRTVTIDNHIFYK
jgi:N-acetylmuramoyl-L-alanine amidase